MFGQPTEYKLYRSEEGDFYVCFDGDACKDIWMIWYANSYWIPTQYLRSRYLESLPLSYSPPEETFSLLEFLVKTCKHLLETLPHAARGEWKVCNGKLQKVG